MVMRVKRDSEVVDGDTRGVVSYLERERQTKRKEGKKNSYSPSSCSFHAL